MMNKDKQNLIFSKLNDTTHTKNWKITKKISARECDIFKAQSSTYPYAIAIKAYHNKKSRLAILQYNTLDYLSSTLNTDLHEYYVPNTFGNLPEESIFMMEWVDSPPLEKRLWGRFYSKTKVQSDLYRSFSWLKEFHSLANPGNHTVSVHRYKSLLSHYLKINTQLSSHSTFSKGITIFNKLLDSYQGFKVPHADRHGDFTPSNILIDDNRVISIDMIGNQNLPVANDIALLFSYVAIEYPCMLTQSDFRLPPEEWPLLKLILEAYRYPKDPKQIQFFLFVFLYELLRRWLIINDRNKNKRTTLLDRWRLRNTEMIVRNLCIILEDLKL